jgi:cell shape-determining protein MreC
MFWFIQVSVVSLIIIFVLHNLYSFFKETLTVPKIKDMVKRPQQKYDMLFRELHNQVSASSSSNGNGNGNEDMKNELKRYLMDLNSTAQPQPQSQQYTQQQQYPQPQSDFIELGSTYQ